MDHEASPDHEMVWAGRRWKLSLRGGIPGIRRVDHAQSVFLSIAGAAHRGRKMAGGLVLDPSEKIEFLHGRRYLTLRPSERNDLKIRASWGVSEGSQALDLEVELSATSVGELKAVEIFVESRFRPGAESLSASNCAWVQPRDARSAALSYDGRESGRELQSLTTLPLVEPPELAFVPTTVSSPWGGETERYLEMVHPQDVARRITITEKGRTPSEGGVVAIRYGLFGHDLEKGVVLRGRLRGAWIPPDPANEPGHEAYQRFLARPLPLGR
jgi:hypothetical protein